MDDDDVGVGFFFFFFFALFLLHLCLCLIYPAVQGTYYGVLTWTLFFFFFSLYLSLFFDKRSMWRGGVSDRFSPDGYLQKMNVSDKAEINSSLSLILL